MMQMIIKYNRLVVKTGSALIVLLALMEASAAELTPISLAEALNRALEHNPALKQADWEVRSSKWGLLRTISDALPKVNFNSSIVRMDQASVDRQNIMRDVILQQYSQYINPEDLPPFAYRTMYSSSISVNQPIYNGGVEFTALRIASTTKKTIKLSKEAQRQQLILNVETAYYNLCRAYQAVSVQNHALKVTQGYLQRFRRRNEMGLIADVDVLRWEAEESNAQASLMEAQKNLRLAELNLERTMGVFDNRSYLPIDLTNFLSQEEQNFTKDILPPDIIWKNVKATSPDLQISRNNITLKKQNVWIASANFQPKLNFNYTYSWETDDDLVLDGFKTWTAGISLTFPLFSSFGSLARYQEARIAVKEANEQARDFENGWYIQLTGAYNRLLSATARLKAARKMFEQAEKVLQAQEKRFDLGLITSLELLDAQATHQKAELGVVNALFDALTARAELHRIAGDAEVAPRKQ